MSTGTDQSQAIKAHLSLLCEQLQAAWAAYSPYAETPGPDVTVWRDAWFGFQSAAKVLVNEIRRVTQDGYEVTLESCCTNNQYVIRTVSGSTNTDMLQYSTVENARFCYGGIVLRHCQVVDVKRIEAANA